MAHHDMNTMMSTTEMVGELVMRTLRNFGASVGRTIEQMAETSSYMKAAQKIADMTDEELAAKGMTRTEAIQRALGRYV